MLLALDVVVDVKITKDVITLFSMVADVSAMVLLWQMLKTTRCCNVLHGRCYCQCDRLNSHCRVGIVMVDVNTIVVDGIATRV